MAYIPPFKVGQTHDRISDAKAVLSKFSYGAALRNDRTDIITEDYLAAQRQFKINVHNLVITRRRPGPDVDPTSVAFDWAVQKQLGLLGPLTPPPPTQSPIVLYPFTGTWGAWDNGFGFDVAVRADQNLVDVQGMQYNTNAFMIGNDPGHSYVDMLNDGVGEYLRLALPERRKKVLLGYSGGAGCAVQALHAWPADRRGEILAVIQFGDPNRPPGKTLLGNDPGGHGISEDFPPDWIIPRYYSFTIDGDMYPNAVGLLPIFYDILTRMEATPEFAMYLFSIMVDQVGNLTPLGGGLLGVGSGGMTGLPGAGLLSGLLPLLTGGGLSINLISMLLNIPAIVQSLIALLKFVMTNAHGMYNDPGHRLFDGMTAVDKAVTIVNALR